MTPRHELVVRPGPPAHRDRRTAARALAIGTGGRRKAFGETAAVDGIDLSEADAGRGRVSLTGPLASVDEEPSGRENVVLPGRLPGLRTGEARRRAAGADAGWVLLCSAALLAAVAPLTMRIDGSER